MVQKKLMVDSFDFNTEGQGITLVYIDSTVGWRTFL